MPIEIRRYSDRPGGVGRHAGKNENLGAGMLQDRHMCVEILIRNVVGDIDDNHPCEIAESFLQSLEQISPELIVLPENHDLFSGIEGLNIIRVDASLGPERWLPAYGPGKCFRIVQLVVAGGDKELGNLPIIQIFPGGEITG